MAIPRELIYKALISVSDFLGKNYPCQCANHPDDDCPGEIAEAEEVIRMTLAHVAADLYDEGYEDGMHDCNEHRPARKSTHPYRASETA